MNSFFKILLLFFIINTLNAKEDLIESQPQIIFQYDKLKQYQDNFALQVEFNKAVLLLQREEYEKAIELFLNTSEIIETPSFLNIGIAYYKLNSIDKAVIYLNKIFENPANKSDNSYSYMASCYYLYQISKDQMYLDEIIKLAGKFKNLSEHSKKLVVDTLIILKDYERALKMINVMKYPNSLKKALLHIKLREYNKAYIELEKEDSKTVNPITKNRILWFKVFVSLKSNNLVRLSDDLKLLNKSKVNFKTNLDLPLEIYFNKDKFTPKEYLNMVLKFNDDRKINFVYYYAPFIFSDYKEVMYDSSRGFIFNDDENVNLLENMVRYNGRFLEVAKQDPIIRVDKLKKLLKEGNNKSYVYYNLGLSYAQIFDFQNAKKYFESAYKLNPGNKLYAFMRLITYKKLKEDNRDTDLLIETIKLNKGMYNYYAKELYSIFYDKEYENKTEPLNYKNTIFFHALNYLKDLDNDNLTYDNKLFTDYSKDPLTYLLKLSYRFQNESDYSYYSRLQDTVPLKINDNFLEGPLIVTNFYTDLLNALGVFSKADFEISGKTTPTYLKTKAFNDLYSSNPEESIKTLEYLQEEYKLEDKNTMFLLAASFLEAGRYNDASIQISLIKALLKDKDAEFLTGVQLIQEFKIGSALQNLRYPYSNSLIDIRLVGIDEYLESL